MWKAVINGALEAAEIQAARHNWIMSVQAESFPGELKSLREKTSDRSLPYLTQFGLFIDEKGVLRCRGRIEKSHLPEVTCHPALLPTRHHLSDLIVKEAHYYMPHSGVRATLTAVRKLDPEGERSRKACYSSLHCMREACREAIC